MDESVSNSTTVYVGNTRTIANEDLYNYCSKFGLVLDFSRRLVSPEQSHLVDFTFVRFATRQSASKFLSIPSHTLKNDIALDIRPFSEVLHQAVPLQVDRKICIRNVSGDISVSDLRKYLRTFGSIKQATSEIGQDEQRYVYVEFESAASRNKLLRGKVAVHRVRDERLNIFPMLRPTEVNLHRIADEKYVKRTSPAIIDSCMS